MYTTTQKTAKTVQNLLNIFFSVSQFMTSYVRFQKLLNI